MSNDKKRKVITNFIWRFLERVGAQGVAIVVSIVLQNILGPDGFGNIVLIMAITAIMQVLVDSGLGNALIQKKDADHLDFSTVFFFNIFVCVVLYIVMFVSAPYIAGYYKESGLTNPIRVLSFTILISGVKNVQQAYVSKNMIFKKFFFSTIGGTVVAAVIGIGMAINGYGVWAFVAQTVVNTAIDTFILWITVDFRPRLEFSFARLKALFSFGWKLLISALINTGVEKIRVFIIGKRYTFDDLSFYNTGQKYPELLIRNIDTSISSVLLPAMSEEQDNVSRIKTMTRRAIKTSIFFMAPAMLGLAACGNTITRLIYEDDWSPVVPFLVIFCITYVFYPIATANLNAMMAMGRSDLFLKLEIIKKVANLIILLLTYKHGVMAIAYGLIVMEFIGQIVNTWPNKKLIGYSYREQLWDILPTVALAVFMSVCVYGIGFIGFNHIITFILQMIIGMVIYIVGAMLFKFEIFTYMIGIIRDWNKR